MGPSSPTLSLPKGGGAIRGIGEKFATNPVTGTGSTTVPIATSLGRSGFGPQLALSYDSGTGNGVFGFGWNLSLPSITRKTDKGLPQYRDAEESDVFILSGTEDLVPLLNPDGSCFKDTTTVVGYTIHRYRPRIEGLFARIERWTRQGDGDVHWRSISKDNILTLYGKDNQSRIVDPTDPGRVFTWLICETRDDKGNALLYEYKAEDGANIDLTQIHERNRGDPNDPRRTANRYLKHIRYGNRTPLLDGSAQRPRFLTAAQIQNAGWMFEVVFDYGEHNADAPKPNDVGPWSRRLDPFSSYRAGFEVRTSRLCQRVLMFHHFADEPDVGNNCLVRSTDFTYSHEEDPANATNPIYTFLLSVTQSGYKRLDANSYLKRNLPPITCQYTKAIVHDTVWEVDAESLENLPIGLDGRAYQWTDLHGEGIPGILSEQTSAWQAGAWFYKRNLSPVSPRPVEFAPLECVATKPNLTLASGQAQFMDLAGDGQPDLVVLDGPMPGLYEHDDNEGWQPSFRPFTSRLNHDMRDPNLKFIDLSGDGHADLLISENDAFVWHASLAEEGFSSAQRVPQALDEEKGPRLVFANLAQSIYLADLSGDGLTDLVRIRNGEVCYWPNLGYGRFGAKVSMDHAPRFDHPDQFDPKRIRLADIDGTGTTDILYLHRDGVRLYFNQSGNSWSAPQTLNIFPRVDDLTAITPIDLKGNGTACLVWSSPLPSDTGRQMRYVDLMRGQKPHLLVKMVNNLGAETRIQYAPSTKFYLEDKRNDKPWITKLPFPVHVVERVETYDFTSRNRFFTRYAYHHGYFDGEEREFRGFGMVEQWDTEEFATLSASDVFPTGNNINETSHVPPVLTKTWFHTGAYLGRNSLSNFFAGLLDEKDTGEYYREPGLNDEQAKKFLLEDTVLPDGLNPEEEREACRALKGALLRQEVYALDGTDKENHPYVVTEQNFTIRRVQPEGENRHAVFFTHAREAINTHYERDPADPRVSHQLTLEADFFGNVLKSASIGYGRRKPDPALSFEDQAKQTQTVILYTENNFTNSVELEDDYRAPLPCETRLYELTGFKPVGNAHRFSFDEWVNNDFALLHSATEIAYEKIADPDQKQKRPIEQVRTLYRKNDLSSSLQLSQVESLALGFESYKLALTPGLISLVYGERVTDSMLLNEGKYLHFDGDANWWIPSGRVFFHQDPNATPAEELGFAQKHFFLPHRFRDPFGNNSFVSYDKDANNKEYDLLVAATRDALGNEVKAKHNYRVLQPALLIDPNGNRSKAAFDALGLVVGTAVMGKGNESKGDLLEKFQEDLTQEQINNFRANPQLHASLLLGKATARILYDLKRYHTAKEPNFAATLARETHFHDSLPPEGLKIQISLTYSDGFGREIQKKIQAEPGPLVPSGENVNPRWVGSGWTIFNNKGKPVRQYEPFFDDTHDFKFGKQVGVSSILFYDPLERVVATLHPNHSYEKLIFDPWRQETWDLNDTVLKTDPQNDPDVGDFFRRLPQTEYLPTWYESRKNGQQGVAEQSAADKASVHAATPQLSYQDTLGRTFLTVVHNRFVNQGNTVEEKIATRVKLDIEGNQRQVIDAKKRIVMRYDYDILGNKIHQSSMEAGRRWMLGDVGGKPIRSWDSRGHTLRVEYDQRRRPVQSFVAGTNPEQPNQEILFERTMYGETQPNPEANNLRERAYQIFDGAGVVTNEQYDFKGNLLKSQRQLLKDYKDQVNWLLSPTLENEIFTSLTTYDALNRPISLTTPDKSEILPTYNEANLLEKVNVRLRGALKSTPFVKDIDYNAKGQREVIEYGSGIKTEYEYDKNTFRLTHLKTIRPTDNAPLQNLTYTYDPVGNIAQIQDEAQQTIYFNGQVVPPHCDYIYDALYRLIEAKGREHIGQVVQPETTWNDEFRVKLPHPGDGQAMRNYTEHYGYDVVGNFSKLIHQAVSGNWTRGYFYNETSLIEPTKKNNQLSQTTVGMTTETYTHDAHGNMTKMPHLSQMDLDFKDQLHEVDLGGGGKAFYVYDTSGQRVRKVVEKNNGTLIEERITLGGYEIFRQRNSSGLKLERETLHIRDESRRIALVETKTVDEGTAISSPTPVIRYQLDNHLGSASLELDAAGEIISYEEYYPYGATSYQAGRTLAEVSLKRYRYTGKERDEETGLYYHVARYYACWLGRWTAVDPIGLADGINRYAYVSNNPINAHDPTGTQSKPQTPNQQVEWRTDAELKQYLSAMTPDQRGASLNSTTGAALARLKASFKTYDLQYVRSGVTTVEHVRPDPPSQVAISDPWTAPPRMHRTPPPFGMSERYSMAPDVPYCPTSACHQPGFLTGAANPDTTRAHLMLAPLYVTAALRVPIWVWRAYALFEVAQAGGENDPHMAAVPFILVPGASGVLGKSAKGGPEVYYRTMSAAQLEQLEASGLLVGGGENFLSPSRFYSEALYEGALVEFRLAPRATEELATIGVRNRSLMTQAQYGELPTVGKGWTENSVFFKAEGPQINLGLGRGEGLDKFNELNQGFSVLRQGPR